MNSQTTTTDASRRHFLRTAARTFLGVGMLPSLTSGAGAGAANVPIRKNPAQRLIFLYMDGGMSHLDTFDPHPEAPSEVKGAITAIPTKADGMMLSHYLPMLSKQADKFAIIRSMTSRTGAHEQARYFMRTSYEMRGSIKHPHLAAWNLKFKGRDNQTLPGFVTINGGSRAVGAGYFDSSFQPLAIGRPESGLADIKRHLSLSEEDFDRRRKLAAALDQDFKARYSAPQISAYTSMYDDAVNLMKSADLDAFDLSLEPKEIRERYGMDSFGQGTLLARRLVESGVRSVEVRLGGWDTHVENFARIEVLAEQLDRGLANLLADLEARGMLDETLVVVSTDFGRTPTLNQNEGRDHYPKAFSTMIAGGRVKGGMVYGQTDAEGREIASNPVGITDFNATIGYGLGLKLDHVLYSPSARPFTVAHNGKPVTELFS